MLYPSRWKQRKKNNESKLTKWSILPWKEKKHKTNIDVQNYDQMNEWMNGYIKKAAKSKRMNACLMIRTINLHNYLAVKGTLQNYSLIMKFICIFNLQAVKICLYSGSKHKSHFQNEIDVSISVLLFLFQANTNLI